MVKKTCSPACTPIILCDDANTSSGLLIQMRLVEALVSTDRIPHAEYRST
jgi:hypothetical protein